MKYVILDWVNKKYCWVSVKIPDDEMPYGIICRTSKYVLHGELRLPIEWKYEPRFRRYEKDYLHKTIED